MSDLETRLMREWTMQAERNKKNQVDYATNRAAVESRKKAKKAEKFAKKLKKAS